jgi:hypothetical protein
MLALSRLLVSDDNFSSSQVTQFPLLRCSGWEWISGLGDRSRYRMNKIPITPNAVSMIMSNTHQPE